ncbi:hypothetical protein NFI96_025575, partial [Prochilodus magdalenae]
MWLLFFMVLGLSSVRLSSAYADGSVADACGSMVPGHTGFTPQMTNPPYRVRVNRSTYTPGESLTVTLEAVQSGTDFQGFMLQARRTAGGAPVGSFSSTNTGMFRLHKCFNMENSTISHASANLKTQFVATWVAPLSPSLGNIEFCATFVKDYSNFWTMVSSNTVLADSSV